MLQDARGSFFVTTSKDIGKTHWRHYSSPHILTTVNSFGNKNNFGFSIISNTAMRFNQHPIITILGDSVLSTCLLGRESFKRWFYFWTIHIVLLTIVRAYMVLELVNFKKVGNTDIFSSKHYAVCVQIPF